jgi:hypothetical protein
MQQTEQTEKPRNMFLFPIALLSLAAAFWTLALPAPAKPGAKHPAAAAGNKRNDAAIAAFLAAAPVFVHPRCVNCHAPGDAPRQGMSNYLHAQNVRRGVDGRGKYGVKCASCHMTHNLPGEHLPPGAPNWKLPPAAAPLAWERKTPGEICRQLKDPAQNGHHSPAEIVQRMQRNPLVKWGWDPGLGRTPAPGTQAEFTKNMAAWAAAGGACPD